MPAFTERRRSASAAVAAERRAPSIGRPVEIGVVNNMPDAALQSTERQILSLLNAASADIQVRIRFWALPGMPRTEFGEGHIARHYARFETISSASLDALIVTGSEPRQEDFAREPYWDAFVGLVEWAKLNTTSTIWSCLAAHAAAFHLDAIDRRPLQAKKFGVFRCSRVDGNAILHRAPSVIDVPHSRWNELGEDDLRAAGYAILTRSDDTGADMFAKDFGSLFLFMQGHPEYDAQSLLLEYRRDVGRYLSGRRAGYPDLPANYFCADGLDALRAFEARARAEQCEDLLAQFPTARAAKGLTNRWRGGAEAIFADWLAWLQAARDQTPGLARAAE